MFLDILMNTNNATMLSYHAIISHTRRHVAHAHEHVVNVPGVFLLFIVVEQVLLFFCRVSCYVRALHTALVAVCC